METVNRGDDDLPILDVGQHLFFEAIVSLRLQHVFHVVQIDADVLDVQQDLSATILHTDEPAAHLLVVKMKNLLTRKQEVPSIII